MYELEITGEFCAAHFLAGYPGKCKNIHGHTWQVKATILAYTLEESGPARGMVMDFHKFKTILNDALAKFDHRLIYEKGELSPALKTALDATGFELLEVPYRPTAENLARAIYDDLRAAGLFVGAVEVQETPTNVARFKGGNY